MIRQSLIATFAVAASLMSTAAWAKVDEKGNLFVDGTAIQEKKLLSGKQTLSPDKGYVFVHGPSAIVFRLIKEPNDAERAAFEAQWQEAFDKAKKKYPRQLQNWQNDVEFAKKTRATKMPEKPLEPTEEIFSIGPMETRLMVNLGGGTYARQKGDPGDYSALAELEPGTYRYYGTVFPTPGRGAALGTCECMGSITFKVEAGKITNLGDFLWLGWADADQGRLSSVEWEKGPQRHAVDYTLPTRLASFPNAPAEMRAAGKIDNFLGLMVGRLPPVPGVLGYQRDKVIDLKAQTADAAVTPQG